MKTKKMFTEASHDAAIWIDREHARIFRFSDGQAEKRETVMSSHADHHTHAFTAFDLRKNELKFFGEVAGRLEQPTRLLILGPGLAKHHFQNYLMEHQPQLARRIAGCETVDHPTDNQIAAFARQHLEIPDPRAVSTTA